MEASKRIDFKFKIGMLTSTGQDPDVLEDAEE